jgi:DNA repair exonuclease SbcCD nuclease subunit
MDRSTRFLHAADLHLERPPGGLAEIPDHLRTALVDAPYRAAARVFDAAVKQQVDFVVLAGDVVDPLSASPRAIVFLGEQLQKLADHGIRVFWAGGRGDCFERMIDAWPLPENVHRFSLHRVERLVHTRAGEPLVQVLGTSVHERGPIATADFHPDPGGPFSVAVAYGTAEPAALEKQAVDYWALGGRHSRDSLVTGAVTAHYCGTPQGRRPKESGPRGCTLVQVDETRRVRTVFVPTDAVRYCDERVAVDESTTSEQLIHTLNERIGELLVDPFGPELFIRWTVLGSRALAARLRSGNLGGQIMGRLRDEHGAKRPAAWTVAIQAAPTHALPDELYDEQSLLGEFLRAARQRAARSGEPLELAPFLAERHRTGPLASLAEVADPAARRRALAAAAALGSELLSPREGAP